MDRLKAINRAVTAARSLANANTSSPITDAFPAVYAAQAALEKSIEPVAMSSVINAWRPLLAICRDGGRGDLFVAAVDYLRELEELASTHRGDSPTVPGDEFISASTLLEQQERFGTYKQLKGFLDRCGEIRTCSPSPRRFLVHAGDWHRYWKNHHEQRFKSLDSVFTPKNED